MTISSEPKSAPIINSQPVPDHTAVLKRVASFTIPATCVLCDVPADPHKTLKIQHKILRGGFNEVVKVHFPLCTECIQAKYELKINHFIAAIIASAISLPIFVIYLFGFTNAGYTKGGPNGNLLILSIVLFGIIYWIATVLLKRRFSQKQRQRLSDLEYAASINYFDSVFVKFHFRNADFAAKFRGLNEVYNPPSVVDYLRAKA